jgi:hypothetical protein
MMNQEQLEQEVARLADAWATAELQSDTPFLEKILADTFVGVGPLGFLLTKQEWLARLQSGDLKYNALTLDETKVRVYNNDAAIMICRQVQDAAYRSNPIMAQLRTTLVFVQQKGQWQLAGLHVCNIGQPPPFARS